MSGIPPKELGADGEARRAANAVSQCDDVAVVLSLSVGLCYGCVRHGYFVLNRCALRRIAAALRLRIRRELTEVIK